MHLPILCTLLFSFIFQFWGWFNLSDVSFIQKELYKKSYPQISDVKNYLEELSKFVYPIIKSGKISKVFFRGTF